MKHLKIMTLKQHYHGRNAVGVNHFRNCGDFHTNAFLLYKYWSKINNFQKSVDFAFHNDMKNGDKYHYIL